MNEKKVGAIKIDWVNMKVQFSPNITLVSKKNQKSTGTENSSETILRFELFSDKIETSDCQTFLFQTNELINVASNNIGNPWYFDFVGETPISSDKKTPSYAPPRAPPQIASSNPPVFQDSQKPTIEPPKPAMPKPAPEKAPSAPAPLFKTLQKPTIEPPKPAMPKPAPEKAPSAPAPLFKALQKTPTQESQQLPLKESFPDVKSHLLHLEDQLAQTRDIILNLDKRFSSGLFNLEEYLKKKNFLIKKVDTFKDEIGKLKP